MPRWRRVVAVVSAVVFFFLGSMATFQEIRTYESAPKEAVVQSGNIYRVQVMHGSIRYVTAKQAEQISLWRETLGSLVGIPFVIGAVVLFTFRGVRRSGLRPRDPE